ncbi:glycosyltransferase 25 family [Nesidiocoris tenuis]|uniref:Glycosyltransferase 25 family n=1 Tax=Nesidiocoris tenuis TaxID=355587 RepID=A0ABN7B191_9HEMI|nr:glycosyltransferase 25 family [Nesidiocoris tenuis]
MAVLSGFVYMIFAACHLNSAISSDASDQKKSETVLISILVRNKAHTLPYFLTYLEKLDYPKDRISLWIRSDHNQDNSIEIVEKWLTEYGHKYHSVHKVLDKQSPPKIEGEQGLAHWPKSRYHHVIPLRESALHTARYMWADYIWVLDCDVFITNSTTLRDLIAKNLPIVAPALRSDGLYSNFWCGMSSEYYYMRTEEYGPILNRKKRGCFTVPMVHSSVLINLRSAASDGLTYDPQALKGYQGPFDDIITFARSANMSGINMTVCNDVIYGYVMVPLERGDLLYYDLLQLKNLKLEVLINGPPLEVDPLLEKYVQEATEPPLQIDKIFMINLKRRPDRRVRMLNSFKELRLDVETMDAVDGR